MTRGLLAPVVLLTGNPSAGKTTLAGSVAHALSSRGVASERLDGDELRERLPPSLGFSVEDRQHQLQRAAFIAELLARHGVIPILALVAPFAAHRQLLRARFADRFVEVFLDPPVEICLRRDSNGLYARLAAEGGKSRIESEVLNVYEPPADPSIRIDTARVDVAMSTRLILDEIAARRSLTPPISTRSR